jgi:hypothetical protein
MAVFTDILQSAADFDERSGILFLSGRQHFEAHTAQGPGEGIESFALVPDDRSNFCGLQLDTRGLRLGSWWSHVATLVRRHRGSVTI